MKDTEENQELSKQLNQYFKLMISFTSSADQAINRTVACKPSPHPKGKTRTSLLCKLLSIYSCYSNVEQHMILLTNEIKTFKPASIFLCDIE